MQISESSEIFTFLWKMETPDKYCTYGHFINKEADVVIQYELSLGISIIFICLCIILLIRLQHLDSSLLWYQIVYYYLEWYGKSSLYYEEGMHLIDCIAIVDILNLLNKIFHLSGNASNNSVSVKVLKLVILQRCI